MQHSDRFARVTIYTERGPVEAEHLESRCKRCNKGYYYGYVSDTAISEPDNDAHCSNSTAKQHFKFYEEDCLESEVRSNDN